MKKRIVIVLFVLFLCGSGIRLYQLNKKYPQPVLNATSIEEVVSYNDCDLSINKAYFLDKKSVENIFSDELSENQHVDSVVIEITISNNTNIEKMIDLSGLVLTSASWKNTIHFAAFLQLNTTSNLNPILNSHESVSFKIPFSINSMSFKSMSDWENIRNRDYSLVLSLYPEKNIISLPSKFLQKNSD